jgi:nicotinamidase-related amidase
MSSAALRVEADKAVLLLIDFQEKLASAMAPAARAACERNILILLELARRLRIPVVQSEQYPRGLGPTVAAFTAALAAPDLQLTRMEKLEFACTEAPGFRARFDDLQRGGRDQWIVVGMETHVCVWQTARGLLAWGGSVQVPADAVISRSPDNHRVGLALAERAGALVTSTETVAFDALVRAGGDDFKAISRLVR